DKDMKWCRVYGVCIWQEQGHRLRPVADRVARFRIQPFRNTRPLERPFAKKSRRNDLARLSSGKKVQGPCGVMRSGILKVVTHRFDLFVGLVRLIKLDVKVGKEFHRSDSLSS